MAIMLLSTKTNFVFEFSVAETPIIIHPEIKGQWLNLQYFGLPRQRSLQLFLICHASNVMAGDHVFVDSLCVLVGDPIGTTPYGVFCCHLKTKTRAYRAYLPDSQLVTDKSRKKNSISPPRKSKKKLTIELLSLGIYASGPQVLTYRPQILRVVRI